MYANEQSNSASSDSRAARQVWKLVTLDPSTNNSKEAACILKEAVIFLSLDLKLTDQCEFRVAVICIALVSAVVLHTPRDNTIWLQRSGNKLCKRIR